jgi:replicative DNA helicase
VAVAEETLYSHLTNTESLDYIIKQGFAAPVAREVIPLEFGRTLVEWCIDTYFESGRKVAPSKEAIMATWGPQLQGADIEIDDQTELDPIEWVIKQLRSDYAAFVGVEFGKMLIQEVVEAEGPDKVGVMLKGSQLLHAYTMSLIERKNEKILQDGLEDVLKRYEEVASEGHTYKGLTLGLEGVDADVTTPDQHFMGIHPGELGVLAGTSGGGKSWFSLLPVLSEFERGRRPVLYTLENDLDMTFDRLACMKLRVPYEKLQRGECEDAEIDRIRAFHDRIKGADNQPLIIRPSAAEATGSAMIRRAHVEGADSVIIDQLSHIQAVSRSKARQRNEVVAEIVRDLVELISEGNKLPLLLLHQINRKGREEARKIGRFLMDHLGEATQVENDASFVWAIYQSSDHVVEERAELQTLKSRRVKPMDWEIEWRPYVGDYRVRREIERD